MATYEGAYEDGTEVRIHIDDLDPEYAYLYTRAPGDNTKWAYHPVELRTV